MTKVILGRRHSQITESELKDGKWTVKVWMKIEETEDFNEWVAQEFGYQSEADTFAEAFQAAISGVMDALYEEVDADEEDGQALLKDN